MGVRAIFPNKVLLIQVKKDYIGSKELHSLKEFSRKITVKNIGVEVWMFKNGKCERASVRGRR